MNNLQIYFQLFLVGLIPFGLSIGFYFVKKCNFFKNLPNTTQQIIIGLFFGGAAVLGTVLGVDIGGATANARDAAPLCAGLLFGGPAGIIAGFIGGVYRFIASYWGAGMYSQVACSISTFIAGIFAALLRKYMFENKRPTWAFGFATGVVMEVFHMTVLFLTHIDNSVEALGIVEICTIPMIVCNSVSVTLSILFIDLFSGSLKKNKLKYRYSKISQQIQGWLLLVVVLAYLATTSFVYVLQTRSAEYTAETVMDVAISDLKNQIGEENNLNVLSFDRHVGEKGFIIIADASDNVINVTVDEEKVLVGKTLTEIGIKNIADLVDKDFFENKILNVDYFCSCEIINDYYCISIMTHEEVYQSRDAQVYINSYMEVLVFAALFIIVYGLIKRKVVDNIRSVNESLSKIIDGDLTVSVDVKSSEEFFSLSNDINSTVATLKNYIDEAAKRIDAELQFAKNIQHSALPSIFPAFPSIKQFDIYATMITAKEVGGDFYDFYLAGKHKLAFLIADVSGKGIPAAMFMMRAKTLLKSLCESGLNPAEVFTEANNKLCEGNDAGMFVTAFLGILDYKTGHVEYSNAGHNPPIIYRKDRGYEMLKCKHGFVLAGMEGVNYKLESFDFSFGDKICLYTDGVTEATDLSLQLYGENRLIDYLNLHKEESAMDTVLGIKKSVDNFVGDAEQFDDITIMSLIYSGDESTNAFTKQFNALNENYYQIEDFLTEKLTFLNVPMKLINQLKIVTEEIFVNVAKHAYSNKGGNFWLSIDNPNNSVKVKFIDEGAKFDPLAKEDPDITLSAEDREIGGLGIFMVKKLMDNVEYEYLDNKNILTITKKL